LIAIFHGISKAMGKKQTGQATRQSLERVRQQMEQDRLRAQRRVVKRITLAPNVALRVPPPVPRQRRAKTPPTKRVQGGVPVSVARISPDAPPTPIENRSPKPTVKANALALHTWLRPATLRQQFILTEVLQKPLALRDGHAG